MDTLAAAESLWKRRDHDGAWLKIEELPPIDRVLPQVINVRLRICTSVAVDNQLSRGRLYLWRGPDDLMARITPLGPRSMLLETPPRNSWIEHRRGQLATVLKAVEGNSEGTFHGLGSLVAKGSRSAQAVLHRDLKIPVRTIAEPECWYSMHRKPVIAEVSGPGDRVLVRFVAHGMTGSFHGTCMYALRDGEWGCYTIKPGASETIATAENWLGKREWNGWT